MAKMREVLKSGDIYPYLRPNAVTRLQKARRLAHETGLLKNIVVGAGGESLFVLPWIGSKKFRTLQRELKYIISEPLKLRSVLPTEPYYLTVSGPCDADELQREILHVSGLHLDPYSLLDPEEAPFLGKFDDFVQPDLLRKAFIFDGLDMDLFGKTGER
jgi:ATP-dependent Lhr-like helicase